VRASKVRDGSEADKRIYEIQPLTRLLLLILTILLPSVALADITGTATVMDGDMLEVRGTSIRPHGIDAPESSQLYQRNGKNYRCGQRAAAADDLIA
jgi:endonuclease YncB( thermonuclease family)